MSPFHKILNSILKKLIKPSSKIASDKDFFYEYWIGEGIDLKKYWDAYYGGNGYMKKFNRMECYVIEITFRNPNKDLPLYNFEPIYKTLKAYYHEIKKDILDDQEYNDSGPLFLYEVNRGSGIWTFLGELWYVLTLGTTLTEEKIKGQRIDNLDKKLKMLKEYFGDVNIRPELFNAFIEADTPLETQEALQNLFKERIEQVRISRRPFKGNIEDNRRDMLDLNPKQLESGSDNNPLENE